MKLLRNIFITLIMLLNFNGVSVKNRSLNTSNKNLITTHQQKFYHVLLDSFTEDTTQNEGFDLEEDTDTADDDFLKTMFSENVFIIHKSFSNTNYFYSFSHQSIKKFILYCSLKLHC